MTDSTLLNEENARQEKKSWYSLSAEQVMQDLQVHENGLSEVEAARRLKQYGPNQLVEKPRPGFLRVFWDQINSFVIWLLIVAAVISGLIGWNEYAHTGETGEFIEAGAIMAIVILNAVMGIIQERRAEDALAALKKMAAPDAQVLRDGHRVSLPARDLVQGDIVFLEAGYFIPADVRLLEAVNLRVDESSLTGESVPVQKNAATLLEGNVALGDRRNTAYMGTTVAYGRGRAVVTDTGMMTQLGMIAEMLQSVEDEETPLQRRLDQLGKYLSIGSIFLVVIVFIVALINQTVIADLFSSPGDYFKTYANEITNVVIIVISLAIAAVPEGLPAVVTISLALGMTEMVKRHALIRKLSSVETLGSATTICSDKTGTLTQNEMTVTRLWADGHFIEVTGTGYVPRGEFLLGEKPVDLKKYPGILSTLWVGMLNNDALLEVTGESEDEKTYRIVGDPTEGALIVAAAKAGAWHGEILDAYPRASEVPFDSERKRMITVHSVDNPRTEDFSPFEDDEYKGWNMIALKGAPDVVLELCDRYMGIDNKRHPMDPAARQRILDANDVMTAGALRVLGVAGRVVEDVPEIDARVEELEHDLVFVGLIGMIDPARPEVKVAIAKAERAGIRTVMITGDYPNTARAIAQAIGLLRPGHKVATGADVDKMSDDDLKREIVVTDVFARVSPEHKMRIVDALQANDEVVAMTGDGVNDAPAIKRADIGVAMGITGTDVAKGTADMVLTDDNYASIVSAVEQGRVIYSNIRKFVSFLLSSNIAEIMIIFLATLAGLPAPLTAIQLLWLNLITDGAPALALAMEKGDPDIMEQKPRRKKESIINGTMTLGMGIQTIMQTGVVLSAFILGLIWELAILGHLPGVGQSGLSFLLSFNWKGVDIDALHTAETMAFVTLSLCELFRASTARAEKVSLFRIGIFSNKWMLLATGLSVFLLIAVCTLPFLQTVFNTQFLSLREWLVVIGLAFIPAIAEEITKLFIRLHDRRQAVKA